MDFHHLLPQLASLVLNEAVHHRAVGIIGGMRIADRDADELCIELLDQISRNPQPRIRMLEFDVHHEVENVIEGSYDSGSLSNRQVSTCIKLGGIALIHVKSADACQRACCGRPQNARSCSNRKFPLYVVHCRNRFVSFWRGCTIALEQNAESEAVVGENRSNSGSPVVLDRDDDHMIA